MTSARIPGHALYGLGMAHNDRGGGIWRGDTANGRGKCECSALSPWLPSNTARQQWHREHKADIAAARAEDADRAARTFELSDDQLDAVRELLALVHYDDLAVAWLDLLPAAFHPRIGGQS